MDDLILKARDHARNIMMQNDGSHDFEHVVRVEHLARLLYVAELEQKTATGIVHSHDLNLILLAAWLHDVGDRKYIKPGDDASSMVYDFLRANGSNDEFSNKVQMVCTWVSYSNELDHPIEFAEVLRNVPELAIVQDADRLDALGAVGIARCFSFGGMKKRSLDGSIRHFQEKLLKLKGMMKTQTGRKWAEVRSQKISEFHDWLLTEQEGRDCI